MTLHVSEGFLSLVHFQLAQFADRDDVRSLVVYVAQTDQSDSPVRVSTSETVHGCHSREM